MVQGNFEQKQVSREHSPLTVSFRSAVFDSSLAADFVGGVSFFSDGFGEEAVETILGGFGRTCGRRYL
jgi:hypothetical protein